MTQFQKDLLSLADNPEKFDADIIEKITRKAGFDVEYLDYDLMLSAIQSMAQKA